MTLSLHLCFHVVKIKSGDVHMLCLFLIRQYDFFSSFEPKTDKRIVSPLSPRPINHWMDAYILQWISIKPCK